MKPTYGSLFAGIGGLDLGLDRAGWECLWQVEINEYARRVLAKRYPDVQRWNDVRTFPPKGTFDVDLICGGFPCQDISVAGRGAGITGKQSGLWGEFARIIRVLRPRFVLVENSPCLSSRGIDRILGDLASLGYDAEWSVLSACTMGAPHTRERLFIFADSARVMGPPRAWFRAEPEREEISPVNGGQRSIANQRWLETVTANSRGDNGVSHWVDRLRVLGNAVCPPVAEWIGKRIMEIHQENM